MHICYSYRNSNLFFLGNETRAPWQAWIIDLGDAGPKSTYNPRQEPAGDNTCSSPLSHGTCPFHWLHETTEATWPSRTRTMQPPRGLSTQSGILAMSRTARPRTSSRTPLSQIGGGNATRPRVTRTSTASTQPIHGRPKKRRSLFARYAQITSYDRFISASSNQVNTDRSPYHDVDLGHVSFSGYPSQKH